MAGRKETQPKEEKKRDASRSRRSPSRKDAKSPAKSRSPARTKSPGRKSPSRSTAAAAKQAAVSPSRRSPARKSPTKSPARKSPTRNVKGVEVVKSVHSTVTATRKEYITSLDSDSDTPDIPPEAKEKPKIAVRGRSRNADIDRDSLKGLNDYVRETKLESDPLKTFSTVLRRSTRASHSADVERVVRLSKYETQAQKLTEFSDDDEVARTRAASEIGDDSKKLVEFGGTLGAAFFILFIPGFVYGIHVFCNEEKCSFAQLPDWGQYASFSKFFDLKTTLMYCSFLATLSALQVLPVGGKKVSWWYSKHEKVEYIANAPFNFICLLLYFLITEIYYFPITDFLNAHYFHFILPSFVSGLLLAVYCYFKSFYVPPSALTTNSSLYNKKLYNFFMGRESKPILMEVLDLKIFVTRAALFGSLLFSTACYFQTVQFTNEKESLTIYGVNIPLPLINPTITLLYMLICVYHLDTIIFESKFLSSFEIHYEGFGYMSAVGYALYPFFLSSLVRYVHYSGVQLEWFILIPSALTFVLGYYLYRKSNNLKDDFRKNPYQKSVAHLETMTTNQGKKLIVSHVWGIVRKPNYLGDILMHLSMVPFVYNVPPVLFLLFTVALLIHRTARDNEHCKQKYGSSWERYCLKVKYILLPKVY